MISSSLSTDILGELIKKSLHKPYVIEKILIARPDSWIYVPEQMEYHDILLNDWPGLLYPKWQIENSEPRLDIIFEATVMDRPITITNIKSRSVRPLLFHLVIATF
jgi:hypothetical protein